MLLEKNARMRAAILFSDRPPPTMGAFKGSERDWLKPSDRCRGSRLGGLVGRRLTHVRLGEHLRHRRYRRDPDPVTAAKLASPGQRDSPLSGLRIVSTRISRKIDSGSPQVLRPWPFPCTEHTAMRLVDDGSTSPTLLSEVSDWKTIRPGSASGTGTIPCWGAGAAATASTRIRLTKSASASGSSWRTG